MTEFLWAHAGCPPLLLTGSNAFDSAEETRSTESESMTGSTPPSSPSKLARPTPTTRKYKTKKQKKEKIRTYTRRKTEIEELTSEMKQLNKQIDSYGEQAEVVRQRATLRQCQFANKMLHRALQEQRISFATTFAMISQFSREKMASPFEIPVRLNKDPFERQAALLAMRLDRLKVGHQFIQQQQQCFGTDEYCERKRFKAANGDLISTKFEVVPFPEVRSIETVANTLQTFAYNLEISISDAVGDITVRENDDAVPEGIVAQHRLVTRISNIAEFEANNVTFDEYYPAGPDQSSSCEHALMLCDIVDEDELFPYRPLTRIRHDVSMIMMLAWHPGENGELVVVMTRWLCARIHKSDMAMPPSVIERIRDSVDKVSEAMLATVRQVALVSV
ncbi:uncharacterized protein KRP23_13926 [Phytophthora ramorum]|uniref:uncharacterized protein n=1 Tax=Phytophthora ramorum TaxID=164328 RepID=UPI0030B6620B|nr:hypothetical protein KRP23_13926 [Phytophthora ramorum]